MYLENGGNGMFMKVLESAVGRDSKKLFSHSHAAMTAAAREFAAPAAKHLFSLNINVLRPRLQVFKSANHLLVSLSRDMCSPLTTQKHGEDPSPPSIR